MSKPTNIDEIVARYQAAIPEPREDHEAFIENQARIERADRLRKANPRVGDADRDRLIRDCLDDTPPLVRVREWCSKRDATVLILGGTVGTGKSLAALWALARTGGQYAHANDLARCWWSYDEHDRRRVEAWSNTHFLVLDDLGGERRADTMADTLFDLFDRRKDRPTIVTTNLNDKQLRERYPNDRVWSRMAGTVFSGFSGDDMRRSKV